MRPETLDYMKEWSDKLRKDMSQSATPRRTGIERIKVNRPSTTNLMHTKGSNQPLKHNT